MIHSTVRRGWAPLALVVLLCGVVAVVSPPVVGAQDAPTYEVIITGTCPATADGQVTYTLKVTNAGNEPIEVVALARTFTVEPGAAESAEFTEGDVGGGLVNSITIDGEPAEGVAVATPACVVPTLPYKVTFAAACPGTTSPGFLQVTNFGAEQILVGVGDVVFTVDPGATVRRDAFFAITAETVTVDGGPLVSGSFLEEAVRCDEDPSSPDDPPSSGDDAPSSDDEAVPISAPLTPKFTG